MHSVELQTAYDLLFEHYGPRCWWPGDSPFEVIVGAILTQNTNWGNVEKAITNLKKHSLLDAKKLYNLDSSMLAELIRPAGYFNVKTKRLKNFLHEFIKDFNADIGKLQSEDLKKTREWLLDINGIGQETADSILLYALKKPIFVIDAYTKRILERHNMVPEEVSYNELQELFMDNLDHDIQMFNEYHALIVQTCKDFCKKKPLCDSCPLKTWNL